MESRIRRRFYQEHYSLYQVLYMLNQKHQRLRTAPDHLPRVRTAPAVHKNSNTKEKLHKYGVVTQQHLKPSA